ncbi:MAG: hypothetical protein L0338_35630 [Acidobacteria bacterium]|nr:hypothetical protein [Acidobacteriota bacterium]
MRYAKPEVSTLRSAIDAIQSSTNKQQQLELDVDQQVRPIEPATSAAYEADE